MPAKAKGRGETAAKAFVRHWIDVLNYTGPAGDSDPLRALSSDACDACRAIADFVDETQIRGGSIIGEGWEIRRVDTVARSSPRDAVVDAFVTVHRQEVRPSKGATPEVFAGGNRLKTFWLQRRGGAWFVLRLEQPS